MGFMDAFRMTVAAEKERYEREQKAVGTEAPTAPLPVKTMPIEKTRPNIAKAPLLKKATQSPKMKHKRR